MSNSVAARATGGSKLRTLVGGSIGHFVEWYDWSIYGFLAGIFASQMFPASSPAVSLIASFSAFAIGFLGRPIGAVVLSPLADKYGRRVMLSATIIMAGLGSLAVALCPTYAQIGVAAPLLLVLARLLQGFSAGGEYQIAITFLNEHASPRNRAFAASPQQLAIGLSVLAATAVSTLLTKYVTGDALTSWGWRVPFLIGAVLSFIGLYLRSGIAETPAFQKMAGQASMSFGAILASILRYPREVFVVFIVQVNSLQYYLWMIFLPTYGIMVGHLDRTSAFMGGVLASVTYCIGVPLFAFISDRIGRKPFLLASAVCSLLFTYPLLSALAVPQLGFGTFAIVSIAGAAIVSLNNAVLGTVFAELFPARVRTSGIGIPYAVCGAIFGGTAPMVATWLHQRGGPLYIALYVMAVSVVTIAAHILVTPETRGRVLD